MSKKLIAVASAAALALTALVAVPAATAAPRTFDIVTTVGQHPAGSTGGSAAFALEVTVPTENVLRFNEDPGDGTTTNVIRFAVRPVGTTDVVRATAQDGLRVLTEAAFTALTDAQKTASAGATSAEAAAVDGNPVTFMVFSRSTVAKSIAFTSGDNSMTRWVKGTGSKPYNLTLVKAGSVGEGTSGDFDFNVTDGFGNVLDEDSHGPTTPATINSVGPITISDPAALTWDADRSVYYFSATGSAAGQASIQAELSNVAAVKGFGTPKVFFTSLVVGGTAADQLEALQAVVTDLQAKLAKRVTKKRFNTLARKWNRAFPSQAVKLKK